MLVVIALYGLSRLKGIGKISRQSVVDKGFLVMISLNRWLIADCYFAARYSTPQPPFSAASASYRSLTPIHLCSDLPLPRTRCPVESVSSPSSRGANSPRALRRKVLHMPREFVFFLFRGILLKPVGRHCEARASSPFLSLAHLCRGIKDWGW